VKHLKYTKALCEPDANDYNFLVPFFTARVPHDTMIHPMEASTSSTSVLPNDITASDQLIPTVAPFNPIPNMFVPMKYRNIISPQPIYNDKGDFIVLGSLEWFTYMYELEKQLA
jgi:hypothetical protein